MCWGGKERGVRQGGKGAAGVTWSGPWRRTGGCSLFPGGEEGGGGGVGNEQEARMAL